jgi:oligopeptide transport system substrate-binding protein
MRVSKFVRFMSLSLSLAVVLALGVGATTAQDDGERKILRTGLGMVGGDLNTIDPAISEVAGENQVISEMFIGLTTQNDLTGELSPGMAESWDVSEDGLTYTYHLMEGVPWVHYNPETDAVEEVTDEDGNVRYVTAHDFVYGLQRTLNPETASPYGFLPADYVVNGQAILAGEMDPSEAGISAVDDYTVEIQVPEAIGFTPLIHGLWMVSAQPQWAIEEGGESWTEPEYINTYGPWTLKEWNHDVDLTLIKNPFWPGIEAAPQAIIDEVVFQFLDPNTQFTNYLAGSIDAIDLPVEETDRVAADAVLSAELGTTPRNCSYYLGFDNTEAPMDNVHLRRAFSLAIDRESLVTNVTKRGEEAAQWVGRPGLNAVPTLDEYPDLGITFNPEEAQAELATALEELGLSSVDELPTLSAAYGDGAGHAAIMQAIQQMWADTLGITVQLNPIDPTTYFDLVSEDAPIIYRTGWCSDYPDENNFTYDLFRSESAQNDPGFNSPEFDELVSQARVSTDAAERLELYAQAEEILVDTEAGVAPVYWYVFAQLVKPYVERTETLNGRQRYERWDIDMSQVSG